MKASEIRERFLRFFGERGHKVVSSDLLVPGKDPTLLFTGAGMNQFKEQFMGRNVTYTRAASCQKCLRTGDLENVGRTPRHHTFFEMLGNFSFGDYFKKDAIRWGWEFMTDQMGIPAGRLWVSVYEDDEESYDIWVKDVGVPGDRIIKLGAHDNFWPADAPKEGPNGPCGPCSEIFYDWGVDKGCGEPDCGPDCDCGRFVEVWNLVFTQFDRQSDGSLTPLPSKNIDTGMGLERMASVKQGVMSNFDTDLFTPIIGQIKEVLGGAAGKLKPPDLNLIADHIRAAVFAIADGVSPSNEKRGYVVRKLIRRAYMKGGAKEPFLYNIVPKVVEMMKDAYPELEEKREHISAIVKEEEKRYDDTLRTAMPVMEEMLSSGKGRLEGQEIFKLVDTYGLPLELISEEAAGKGLSLDIEGFNSLMEQRKEQSRKGSDLTSEFIFQPDLFTGAPRPECVDELPLEADLEFILKDEKPAAGIEEGERAEIITSPQSGLLYSEAGGQVGDKGRLIKDGALLEIVNVFEADGRKILEVVAREGSFKKGERVTLEVDPAIKRRTAQNHTATHLLQAALRRVLGDHVKQSGSYVDDRRLRFDFTHMKKLSDRELRKVEDMVNAWISEDIQVSKQTKSLREAKEQGALSFFGEKYGDTVRVVSVGDESRELCGGTHVDNTAEIDIFKITSESSVASGIRRIEAVTGEGARAWVRKTLTDQLEGLKALAGAGGEDALSPETEKTARDIISGSVGIDADTLRDYDEKIMPAILRAKEDLERAAKKLQKQKASNAFEEAKKDIDALAAKPETLGDVKLIAGVIEGLGMQLLRKAAGYLEKKAGSSVIVLGSSDEGKAYLICAVTPDIAGKGVSAKELISGISGRIGGSGGGRETFAQAGGNQPAGLEEAMAEARRILRGKV